MPLPAGTFLGVYEILGLLGAGGMGEVYRARDPALKREVAIKVLPPFVSRDSSRLQRFEQEAQAAAALNHPNILAVYHFGSFEGAFYLVSELLVGGTLRETMNRGPMPVRKVVDVGVQIASGLAAAHEKGVVHRDLKPENLFVGKDGRVKILDFGLAKLTQPEPVEREGLPSHAEETEPGLVVGTAGYMSPEQVRGKAVDHRADIFALGGILYEMLAGKRAFQRPSWAETMTAILKDDPPAFAPETPSPPPGLQRVMLRCLEKNPEQRFQSASDLAFALEALSDSESIAAQPAKKPAKSGIPRPLVWSGCIFAVLLLAAIGYLALGGSRSTASLHVADYTRITHDGRSKSLAGTDGSRLYFNLDPSEPPEQIAVAGGPIFPISVPIPSAVLQGVSPDGSAFLVGSESIGQSSGFPLWSVGILGGAPRRLADSVTSATWSPDGKFIAYAKANGDLYRMKSNGAEAQKLASIGGRAEWLAWSPDGATLRFSTNGKLREISSNGSNPRELLSGWQTSSPPCCGNWSPDGAFFYFLLDGQIWAMDERPAFFRRRSAAPIQLTSGPVSWERPLPGKDGKNIFAAGLTRRGELARFDPQSQQFRPFLAGISADLLSFSKDGKYVAYISYPDGSLWRADRDGRNPVLLVDSPLQPLLPVWSPDGAQIAFVGLTPKENEFQSYVVSSQGGEPQRLLPADDGLQTDPCWSPDGRKLVFSNSPLGGRDPKSVVRMLDVASGQVTTLPGSQGMFSPRWSPDGRWIAASSFDQFSVNLFDLKTKQWSVLRKGILAFPVWSADSRFLYFLTYVDDPGIFRVRIDDKKVERVVDLKNFAYTGTLDSWMGLDPDDSPLLLRDAGTNDIYALTTAEQ